MIIILKTNGQIVTDDGNPVEITALENAAVILADPKDGDSIVYDATAGVWKAGNPFPVAITEPEDGDTLVYNAAQQKWVNGAGGGGVFVIHKTVSEGTKGTATKKGTGGTATLDANYNQVSAAIEAGKLPVVLMENASGGVDIQYVALTFGNNDEGYGISTIDNMSYTAASATDPLTAQS